MSDSYADIDAANHAAVHDDRNDETWYAHDYDIAYQSIRRILSNIDKEEMVIDQWVQQVAGMKPHDVQLTADLHAAQDAVIDAIDKLMVVRDHFKRNRDFHARLEIAEMQQRPM